MSDLSKRVLSALMVLGAQAPEKAMTLEELSARLGLKLEETQSEVLGLVRAGYAKEEAGPGSRVYLTGTGIITASSTYS